MPTSDLILASASTIRRDMLQNAGLTVEVMPSRVDEESVKLSMKAEERTPRDIADALAELKALKLSNKIPEAFVLGADQVLVFENQIFDKPKTLDQAKEHLRALSGKTHTLLSAAVIAQGGKPIFRHIGQARLTMRPLSDIFLDEYVASEKDDLLTTVGAYKLEGRGSQLFAKVEGDYFSVLGLPLLEILGFMRARKVIRE